MPRIWGEGPHEMYHHTPDGKWTHSGANGLSWNTLEEAKAHYHQSHTSESDFDYITIALVIQYKLDARADGDFKVTFPNISLEFTSAPPMS